MIRFVHQDPLFDKQLNALRRAGKKAAIAAKETDKIVSSLLKGRPPVQTGILTKYGELRIKNCIKYDLGSGYRLITIRQGVHLFLLYIGTHDECNRWLETKRRWQPMLTKRRTQSHSVRRSMPGSALKNKSDSVMNEDEQSFRPIEDKYLRVIFRGLCGG